MTDDLARAYAFLDLGDTYVTRTEPSTVGTAGFLDELPRRLDANYLRVERGAAPEEVLAEARRLGRRMVFVPDAERGEQLVPYFEQQGWRVNRSVVMVQRREPDRIPDLSLVEEVSEEDLRPARMRVNAGNPWGRPEIMAELFAGKHVNSSGLVARFFAVVVGGEIVSYTDLYQVGPDAQVEDIGTLPDHRGHGYARAVTLGAIAAARERGAEFVCLVADFEDWPKTLYEKLGFDEVGYYVKLVDVHDTD